MTLTLATTVAIVGGGPAGASAAIRLITLGVETLIVNESRRAHPSGEVLKPTVRGRLAEWAQK